VFGRWPEFENIIARLSVNLTGRFNWREAAAAIAD
jgi:hypothetical protein